MELNAPATLRRVSAHAELVGPGGFALWDDGSMTLRCPDCGQETWLNPAPVMLRARLTLNGEIRLVCGHRFWILDGKAERC